jgi:hypothetical protein
MQIGGGTASVFAMEGIFSDSGTETALAGVHDRDANAERSEIDSSDDGHEALLLPTFLGVLTSNAPLDFELRLLAVR